MMEPSLRSLLAVDACKATAVERTCRAYVASSGGLRDRDRRPARAETRYSGARCAAREPGPPEGDRPGPGRLVTLNGLAGGMLQSGLPWPTEEVQGRPTHRRRTLPASADGGVESALGLI